jgi:hypothetical protein
MSSYILSVSQQTILLLTLLYCFFKSIGIYTRTRNSFIIRFMIFFTLLVIFCFYNMLSYIYDWKFQKFTIISYILLFDVFNFFLLFNLLINIKQLKALKKTVVCGGTVAIFATLVKIFKLETPVVNLILFDTFGYLILLLFSFFYFFKIINNENQVLEKFDFWSMSSCIAFSFPLTIAGISYYLLNKQADQSLLAITYSLLFQICIAVESLLIIRALKWKKT